MFAISRWMLIGIQVKLLIAPQTEPLSAPDSVMPAGDIMNVTQEFATTRIEVPRRLDRTPRPTWIHFSGPKKWIHVGLGVLSNLLGTSILVVANSWVTFMMSPAGITESGALKGSVWGAINNFTWMPINIHRLIANIVFGGTIAAAYAAFRFLNATTDEERARYDWMGYIGNFVALAAFIVLPFAGYYLGREIYAFNQTMGITMMGGFMSWLWIIQAILIGVLFMC